MKESKAFQVAEMAEQTIITHDDKLLIRAQKHKIKLETDWRNETDITYSDGKVVRVNYMRTGIDGAPESISVERYDALTIHEQQSWRLQPLRGIQLADGVSLSIKNNQVDLLICTLMEDWRSRYRMVLEYMVDAVDRGIIKYRPSAEVETEKNKVEAIRNRLKRHGMPTEYEHDILITGEIGNRIMADLREHAAKVSDDGFTIYTQGYTRHKGETQVSVKVYDIGHREGKGDGKYFKIETTLLKPYFKDKITVEQLTEQPEIQELIMDALQTTLTKVVGALSWEVQTMLAQALNIEVTDRRKAPSMIARSMLRSERTLTERVGELERKVAEHDKRIAAIERQGK